MKIEVRSQNSEVRTQKSDKKICILHSAFCILYSVFCILYSSNSDAFSLGNIEVKSSFNESFMAEIPVSVDGQSGLQVSIGGEDDYSRLGIQRDKFVDSLSLHVESLDKDRAIIKLSSAKPINQPSFNLIIRATLDGGTILENYFLAVDFKKTLSLNAPAADEDMKPDISSQEKPKIENIKSHKQLSEVPREEKIIHEPAVKAVDEAKTGETSVRQAHDADEVKKLQPKTTEMPAGYTFTRNMKRGDTWEDVKNLQAILKLDSLIYPEGIVTGYFGSMTRSAVIRFQEKYASEILSPLGLKSGTGYVGPFTRAKLNALSGSKPSSENIPEAYSKAPAISEPPLAVESLTSGDAIRQKIIEWKKDWESVDLERYISHYSKGFTAGGHNLSSWKENRKNFNQRHKGIEISVGNIQIKREKNFIIASFFQRFKSDKIENRGRKTLYFEREGEEWKIKSEKWNRDIPSVRHPYAIHVSSFRERGAAVKEVNYFRNKGYFAYEVPFNIPGKGSWYRVMIERFFSKSEAEEFARSIIREGHADYAKELELPYAIEAGVFESNDEAFKEISRLGEKGYSSYPLQVCSADKCTYQILIGAYTSPEHARPMSEELGNNGIQNKVVQP